MSENSKLHYAIIGLRIEAQQQQNQLKELLRNFSRFLNILDVSNMYKKEKQNTSIEKVEFICALKISTSLNPYQLSELLKSEENAEVSLSLQVYDKVINIVPDYTLPNPLLVEDYSVLKCASEVWPDYEHPIMKKNLIEMSDSNSSRDRLEFYMQGKDIFEEIL